VANKSNIIVEDPTLSRGFIMTPILLIEQVGVGPALMYGILLWYHYRHQDYPGHEGAARDFSISERAVARYLAKLTEEGLVTPHRPGLGEPNTYTVHKIATLDREP